MGQPSSRERILEVASRLWHAESYDSVGVARICAEAGAQKGSFFHHFASKEELALAVLDRHAEQAREHMDRCMPLEAPPLDRIRALFGMMKDVMAHQLATDGAFTGCPIGNLASELGTRSPAVRAKAASIFEALRGTFRSLLDEAAARGEIEDCDTDRAAWTLLAYMQGMAVLGKTFDTPQTVDPVTAALAAAS